MSNAELRLEPLDRAFSSWSDAARDRKDFNETFETRDRSGTLINLTCDF
jgi:hypothetical protein